jgi:hypothetical protein
VFKFERGVRGAAANALFDNCPILIFTPESCTGLLPFRLSFLVFFAAAPGPSALRARPGGQAGSATWRARQRCARTARGSSCVICAAARACASGGEKARERASRVPRERGGRRKRCRRRAQRRRGLTPPPRGGGCTTWCAAGVQRDACLCARPRRRAARPAARRATPTRHDARQRTRAFEVRACTSVRALRPGTRTGCSPWGYATAALARIHAARGGAHALRTVRCVFGPLPAGSSGLRGCTARSAHACFGVPTAAHRARRAAPDTHAACACPPARASSLLRPSWLRELLR